MVGRGRVDSLALADKEAHRTILQEFANIYGAKRKGGLAAGRWVALQPCCKRLVVVRARVCCQGELYDDDDDDEKDEEVAQCSDLRRHYCTKPCVAVQQTIVPFRK